MFIEGAIGKFGEVVRDRFSRFATVKEPSSCFKDQFLECLSDGGVPIGIAFHFSHVDGLVLAEASQPLLELVREAGLTSFLPRFMIPVAASMESGDQGVFLKNIYPHMKAYAAERGLIHIPIVREKDEKEYRMKATRAQIIDYQNALRENSGVILLPEASVDAGRHVNWWFNDYIKGVTELQDDSILRLCMDSERYSQRKPFFFFIIYRGTHHLYSPDSKLPTPEGLIGLSDWTSHLLETIGYVPPLVEVSYEGIVGREELALGNYSDLKRVKGEDRKALVTRINGCLMRRGVALLDPKYRGFYGSVQKQENV